VLPLTTSFHVINVSFRTPVTGSPVSLSCTISHHASYSAWRTSTLLGSVPVCQQRSALKLFFWCVYKA